MKKLLITLLSILAFVKDIICQDCNNPLLAKYSFESFSTPQAVTGLSHCKSLMNSNSCCSSATINNFQIKTDALKAQLKELVAARDKNLVSIKTTVIPGVRDSLERIQIASTDAMANLTQLIEDSSTSTETIAKATEVLSFIEKALKKHALLFDSFIDLYFIVLQRHRKACIAHMVRIQAASWCLACDPNYDLKGVGTAGELSLSNIACKALVKSCYEYFYAASSQSEVLNIQYLAPLLDSIADSIEGLAKYDESAVDDADALSKFVEKVATAASVLANTPVATPTTFVDKPATKPVYCKRRDCDYLCENVFTDGNLDVEMLAAGGELSTATPSVRTLHQIEHEEPTRLHNPFKERTLEENRVQWNVDVFEALVNASFPEDPGNINKSAGLLKIGLVCILGLFLTLFI